MGGLSKSSHVPEISSTLLTPPPSPDTAVGTMPASQEASPNRDQIIESLPISELDITTSRFSDENIPAPTSALSYSPSQASPSTTSPNLLNFSQHSTPTSTTSPTSYILVSMDQNIKTAHVARSDAANQAYGIHNLGRGRRGAISGPSADYYEGKYD